MSNTSIQSLKLKINGFQNYIADINCSILKIISITVGADIDLIINNSNQAISTFTGLTIKANITKFELKNNSNNVCYVNIIYGDNFDIIGQEGLNRGGTPSTPLFVENITSPLTSGYLYRFLNDFYDDVIYTATYTTDGDLKTETYASASAGKTLLRTYNYVGNYLASITNSIS